jgi:L-2-hydroxyglutarate oxidase LhgO
MQRSLSRARFLKSLQALMPALEDDDIERGGSGVRAQAVGVDGRLIDDFFIQTGPDMLHVLNAPSPAATASLAIGRVVADCLIAPETASSLGRFGTTAGLSPSCPESNATQAGNSVQDTVLRLTSPRGNFGGVR